MRCQYKIVTPRRSRLYSSQKSTDPQKSVKSFNKTAKVNVESDPLDVIGALTEAERVSGTKLDFAKIVSIGNQSSGKSSVIDAITGVEITPKGKGMVSKRPLCVRLKRVATGRWAEFTDGTKLYNFKEIQGRIKRENQLVGGGVVSDQPLHVTICSPEVYNLSVTDLPG